MSTSQLIKVVNNFWGQSVIIIIGYCLSASFGKYEQLQPVKLKNNVTFSQQRRETQQIKSEIQHKCQVRCTEKYRFSHKGVTLLYYFSNIVSILQPCCWGFQMCAVHKWCHPVVQLEKNLLENTNCTLAYLKLRASKWQRIFSWEMLSSPAALWIPNAWFLQGWQGCLLLLPPPHSHLCAHPLFIVHRHA